MNPCHKQKVVALYEVASTDDLSEVNTSQEKSEYCGISAERDT